MVFSFQVCNLISFQLTDGMLDILRSERLERKATTTRDLHDSENKNISVIYIGRMFSSAEIKEN